MTQEQREQERQKILEFKLDLFLKYSVTENSKREMVWIRAWDYGHSAGLQEVEFYFRDLVELIK